jgi:hypothetical protein
VSVEARRIAMAESLAAALSVLLLTFPLAAQQATSGDCIALETFSAGAVGAEPPDWKLRDDKGRGVYLLQEESGRRFLHAASKGLGIQLAKQLEWDLDAYPWLTWSWRAVEFPKGGDERNSKTNDSALAVYLLVPHSKVRGPKAVKYVWSEKVPVGTGLSSNAGLTQVRVLRSGAPASRDAWVEERVNVRDHWKAAFKESATPKPGGIVVLTDADDTSSTAAGDYAGFRACPR